MLRRFDQFIADMRTANNSNYSDFEVELARRDTDEKCARDAGSKRLTINMRENYNNILMGDDDFSDEEIQMIRMGFRPNLTNEIQGVPSLSNNIQTFDPVGVRVDEYNWDGTEWWNDAIDRRHEREY